MCGTLRVPGYSLIGGFHIVLTELIYFVSTVHENNLAHDYIGNWSKNILQST